MSEYGIKIFNIQAGSIYEYNLGMRNYMDTTMAMLTNSLFSDYLKEIGLEVTPSGFTRDLICLEFDYGSKTYSRQAMKVKSKIKELNKLGVDENSDRFKILSDRYNELQYNAEKYNRTKEDLRIDYYRDGVDIVWKVYKQSKCREVNIHYKMLYRSPGKAKAGKIMFIRDSLYNKAITYLRMGMKLPVDNAPIVEIGAYQSLITSTIVGDVEINPKDILILKDYDSFMTTNVVSIMTDKNKRCYAEDVNNYTLKNTMFDGQALIDNSIFPTWGDGYVLLREHFFKAAAFCADIQLFFKDYFKESYDTATVEDMFGNKHYVKDIKLITTENSCKWLKFNVSYEYWCDWVNKNDNRFGIVKTAHKSKMGEVQQMSYQMINSLNINTMNEVMKATYDYIDKMKMDDEAFMKYLRDNANFANDFDVLEALINQDPEFIQSSYCKERRHFIIAEYTRNVKSGKLVQNAENLVLVGSPYAMLLHSVGENVEKDTSFSQRDDCIECYTNRFNNGEYLAFFRSPHNSPNNIVALRNNKDSDVWNRYFYNLGDLILAVNVQHTPMQDRANGCDFDSDSGYVTNQSQIVEHAKWCYKQYPTIVNNIPKEKNHYRNTPDNLAFAIVDNKLSASRLAIGESSNLGQICLSYSYNPTILKGITAEQCKKNVCILSVLAQVAIDNAKRSFDVNLIDEIKRIKSEMNISENKLPLFWKIIKDKNELRRISDAQKHDKIVQRNSDRQRFHSIQKYMAENMLTVDDLSDSDKAFYNKMNIYNPKIECPMNIVANFRVDTRKKYCKTYDMSKFFVKFTNPKIRSRNRKIQQLIEKYSIDLYPYNSSDSSDNSEDFFILNEKFNELIDDINKVYISGDYLDLMSWLIDRALLITKKVNTSGVLKTNLNKNRPLLMKTLYNLNKSAFLKCFSGNIKNTNK